MNKNFLVVFIFKIRLFPFRDVIRSNNQNDNEFDNFILNNDLDLWDNDPYSKDQSLLKNNFNPNLQKLKQVLKLVENNIRDFNENADIYNLFLQFLKLINPEIIKILEINLLKTLKILNVKLSQDEQIKIKEYFFNSIRNKRSTISDRKELFILQFFLTKYLNIIDFLVQNSESEIKFLNSENKLNLELFPILKLIHIENQILEKFVDIISSSKESLGFLVSIVKKIIYKNYDINSMENLLKITHILKRKIIIPEDLKYNYNENLVYKIVQIFTDNYCLSFTDI